MEILGNWWILLEFFKVINSSNSIQLLMLTDNNNNSTDFPSFILTIPDSNDNLTFLCLNLCSLPFPLSIVIGCWIHFTSLFTFSGQFLQTQHTQSDRQRHEFSIYKRRLFASILSYSHSDAVDALPLFSLKTGPNFARLFHRYYPLPCPSPFPHFITHHRPTREMFSIPINRLLISSLSFARFSPRPHLNTTFSSPSSPPVFILSCFCFRFRAQLTCWAVQLLCFIQTRSLLHLQCVSLYCTLHCIVSVVSSVRCFIRFSAAAHTVLLLPISFVSISYFRSEFKPPSYTSHSRTTQQRCMDQLS